MRANKWVTRGHFDPVICIMETILAREKPTAKAATSEARKNEK